jgi:Family of unknown function (DUF6069)
MPSLSNTTNPAISLSPSSLAKGALFGTALGLVANVVVWLIGRIGKPIQIVAVRGDPPIDLALVRVVIATIVAMILGTALLFILSKVRADSFTLWATIVMVIAVLTVFGPLSLKIDAGSKVCLAIIHLLTGATAIAGHSFARRSQSGT